jgi:phosphonoacetaldehyde hydrolase
MMLRTVCKYKPGIRNARMLSSHVKHIVPKRYEAVIGDNSGTWMDPYVLGPAVPFINAFKRNPFNVEITNKEAREPMGNKKDIHIKKITQIPSVREKWYKVHGRYPTDEDAAEIYKAYLPEQIAILRDPKYNKLLPGTLNTFAVLKANHGINKFGLTTGFTADMMVPILESYRKQGLPLTTSVAADEADKPRPYPDAMFLNLRKLGVKDPSKCIKVGDTQADMKEGLACIIDGKRPLVVGLAKFNNYMGTKVEDIEKTHEITKDPKYQQYLEESRQHLYDAGADYVIDTFNDLPKLLETIKRKGN